MRASRLLDLLDQFHGSFTHVFATTYSIDPHFLDAYLLQHVELFADAERICILVDAGVYEQEFVSGQYRSPCINRQYFVHPVRCRGAFHPKVLLAISEKQARLFMGSANLTRDGLTHSLELIDTWDYRASEAAEAPAIFVETLNFFKRTLQMYP